MNMNMERLIKSSLAILLTFTLFGCASSQPFTSKTSTKSDQKSSDVSIKKEKKESKEVSKKKENEDINKEVVNNTSESASQQISSETNSEQVSKETTSQSSTNETITEDVELLNMANSRIHDYWKTYYCFMAGTYFSYDTGTITNYVHINDSRINSLQDIDNVWYEHFSRRYPVPYYDMNINPYKRLPFIEREDGIYELYQVDGIAGTTFFFDHIVKKTSDEIWFAYYGKGLDGNIYDTGQLWSFVYEDGIWKYGQITKS